VRSTQSSGRSFLTRFGLTLLAGMGAGAALFLLLAHLERDASTGFRIVGVVLLLVAGAVWREAGWSLVGLADDAAEGVEPHFKASLLRIAVYLVLAAVFAAAFLFMGSFLERATTRAA